MLRRTYDDQNCSIAKTLELIGERWTLLILRDVFLRIRRFDDIQRDLGIARNVLASRLQRLVDEDVLVRHLYQERPERYEYRLTDKGIDLWPVLVTLMYWGDRHVTDGGPPVVLEHKDCGGTVTGHLTCERCGASLTAREVRAKAGPGAEAAADKPHADVAA